MTIAALRTNHQFGSSRAAMPPATIWRTFDPIAFFSGKTLGSGIVTTFTGAVLRRCSIETSGTVSEAHGAIHFDEQYGFDDGSPTEVLRWAICQSEQGLEAWEPTVVGPVHCHLDGAKWHVRFKRHQKPPCGGPVITYDAVYQQVASDAVTKHVKLKLGLVTVGTLYAQHTRI